MVRSAADAKLTATLQIRKGTSDRDPWRHAGEGRHPIGA